LFWPFSTQRISWNIVSIIDPIFTLPIIIGIILAVYKKNKLFARVAFIYATIFLSLGFIQKQRAEDALYTIVDQRGHQAERILIKPSFANRHVWKLIYEYKGYYYVDAVKLLWDTKLISGASIQKLNIKRDLAWLPKNSQQAKDIERFRWFSDDYLAINPDDKNIIIDVRYSFIPNQIKIMWGIELSEQKIKGNNFDAHVNFITSTKLDAKTRKQFIDILF